jgi:tRNA(Ile)-lysidine synthase
MLKPGHYVLAVSGGVDSMVLLDLLRKRPGVSFTVAHFDHGIRHDSHLDKQLVESVAKEHGLPFTYAKGFLGKDASEAAAREARYEFLNRVSHATNAKAIITAHHLDDLLETAMLNLIRGTGRKGFSSLKSTDGIVRPLLKYPKDRLMDYAKVNKVNWREDSTNTDTKLKRNHVRHNILSKLSSAQKAQLEILLNDIADTNSELDKELELMLHQQPAVDKLDRAWFISLPHDVAGEVLHFWLTKHDVANINRKRVEQLIAAIKTAKPKTIHDVSKNHKIHLRLKEVHIKKT